MTTDDFLRQGIDALNAGRKAEARSLLMQVVEHDQRNEMAWLWLSGAVDTDQERRTCLENVLEINPNNEVAKRGLEYLHASKDVRPLSAVSPPASEAESLKEAPATPSVAETVEVVKRQAHARKCPYCAEEIQEEAIICKHCGRDLTKKPPQVSNQGRVELTQRLTEYETKLVREKHYVQQQEQLVNEAKKRDNSVMGLMLIGLLLTPFGVGFLLIILGFVAALAQPSKERAAKKNLSRARNKIERLEQAIIRAKAQLRAYQ